MPLRAIDFHVHLPTPDWLDGSMAGYVEAAEAYFRSPAQRASLDELAALYRGLKVRAVLLAWDAETATGRPRVPNETVAAACRDYPDVFTGLGSVDRHKGEAAVAEVASIAALGLRGVKFHPSLQAFAPDDPQYWPIFAACQEHGRWPCSTPAPAASVPASPAARASGSTWPTPSSSTRWPRRIPASPWWPRTSAGPGTWT